MKALLTCGIGDFIAMDAVLQPHERPSHVYWATRAEGALRELAPLCFPIVEQTTVFSQFTGPHTMLFCVASREDLFTKTGIVLEPDIVDLNVEFIGRQVLNQERAVGRSSLLASPLTDVTGFNLPASYCVLHPYSQNVRTELRDLELHDWPVVQALLQRLGLPGVVVNRGAERARIDQVIDLTNKTSLLEALQITIGASAFIGCSSMLSVMAAHVVPKGRLFVKGHSRLRNDWAPFYYPHHGDCVRERLRDFCD